MKKLIVAAIVAVGLGMASHASDAETIVSPRITLPTGYEQRQYVTVESGAYVDTDIVATEENDLGFEIVFRESQIPSGTATTPIVGNSAKTDKGANAHWLYFSLVEYSGVWYMGYANAQTNTTNAMKLEVGYHHILFNSGDDRAIIVDGVRGATLPAVPTSQGSNLLLFRRSDIPSRTVFEGELHAFRVFSRTSGEDVANFVPAVETGTSTAGLYDTVRGRFFTAPTDATGSLAAGPAIEDYQRLPRLQFSSGTYVDFGFVVRPEDDCQINFQFDADNYFANKYILGTIGSGIVSGSEVHR